MSADDLEGKNATVTNPVEYTNHCVDADQEIGNKRVERRYDPLKGAARAAPF